jgi:hypothetical protein
MFVTASDATVEVKRVRRTIDHDKKNTSPQSQNGWRIDHDRL